MDDDASPSARPRDIHISRGRHTTDRRWGLGAMLATLLAFLSAIVAALPFLGRISGIADAGASLLPLAIPLALLSLLVGRLRPPLVAVGLGGVALLASSGLIGLEMMRWDADHAAAGAPRLVVVTHNLAYANVDPEHTIQALAASDADILLLQEANGTAAPYLPLLRTRFPYGGGCARARLCDLEILSRLPITRVRWRFRDSAGTFGPDLFWTRATLPNGLSFPIATLHARWPLPPMPQQRFRAALIDAAGRLGADGLIIAGDFNLTPWGHGMAELDHGLLPMRRRTHAVFSFPARAREERVPVPMLPLDHLFAGPDWSTVSVRRLPATGSDHYPLRIELRWTGQRPCKKRRPTCR